MLNLEDEQTSLKSLVTNTQDNFNRVNCEENLKKKVEMISPHFPLLVPKNGGQANNNKPKDN